ncbi:type IV secretion system protein [Nocardioides daeguensis]|uniref:Conjugal transfer protein TrbL n=1 Tax=Nocardioides daeguensis TaxID=908359 RepID=A0ABP6VQW3_9ACTN|nr:type IV secretion system protein [Nocardioides daeguensis]MBV6728546.1 type IV secretion system protein [Nocardioides daeguensis]MCR1773970.1 type IV secretion system protein [Nocardioides daeguensis]
MVDVCDVPVISGVCDVAGEAAGALVSAPFDWLAQAMGNAAGWMFESVWTVFDSTTMVDVTSSQYTKVYNILFGVAVFVMLGFFMLQVIGGMIRREPAALTRAALGLAKSILGSFVALALLASALEITDQLCIGIVHAAGTNMSEMGDRIGLLTAGLVGINVAAPGAGAILTIFLAGLALGAAVIVWISLLIRKALLLVAIVFAPIALAGSSWDQTRGWLSKWAQFVIALILSKVVLVVIFLLATAQVSAPIDADLQSVSEPIAGVVLMLIAGFAPYMTYKAISFMGFDMYHAMSAEQEAKGALNRPLPIPMNRQPMSQPPRVLEGSSGTGGSGGGALPVPASAGPSGGGSSGASGATSGGAASGGAAAAGGAIAGGVVVAKEASAAGPRIGAAAGHQAAQDVEASEQAAPSSTPMPPQVADAVPAGSNGTRSGR